MRVRGGLGLPGERAGAHCVLPCRCTALLAPRCCSSRVEAWSSEWSGAGMQRSAKRLASTKARSFELETIRGRRRAEEARTSMRQEASCTCTARQRGVRDARTSSTSAAAQCSRETSLQECINNTTDHWKYTIATSAWKPTTKTMTWYNTHKFSYLVLSAFLAPLACLLASCWTHDSQAC